MGDDTPSCHRGCDGAANIHINRGHSWWENGLELCPSSLLGSLGAGIGKGPYNGFEKCDGSVLEHGVPEEQKDR